MDLPRKHNGKCKSAREGARRRSRTFDRKGDAQNYMAWLRRWQLGQAAGDRHGTGGQAVHRSKWRIGGAG